MKSLIFLVGTTKGGVQYPHELIIYWPPIYVLRHPNTGLRDEAKTTELLGPPRALPRPHMSPMWACAKPNRSPAYGIRDHSPLSIAMSWWINLCTTELLGFPIDGSTVFVTLCVSSHFWPFTKANLVLVNFDKKLGLGETPAPLVGTKSQLNPNFFLRAPLISPAK